MKTFLNWSGGKDSTASIILAHEHNISIDFIIISVPYFDKAKGIYADHPKHIEWLFENAIPKIKSWGYNVHVVSSDKDYKYWFYRKTGNRCKNSFYNNKYYGWLINRRCNMNKSKFSPVDNICKKFGDYFSIVGIGIDETERLKRLHNRPNQISLLELYGYTTAMSKELCQKFGLLSPYYGIGCGRQGCWFCPNQSINEMAKFKKDYPFIWSELEEMNNFYLKHKNEFYRDNFRFNKTFDEIMSQINTINNQVSIFDLMGE